LSTKRLCISDNEISSIYWEERKNIMRSFKNYTLLLMLLRCLY
jgi:hypothetical protein